MKDLIAKKMLVESIGVFFLVFIGVGSIIATSSMGAAGSGASQLLVVALAHGLALGIAVTAAMAISGGHINPAITISMLVARRIGVRDAALYIFAQVLGAVIAVLLLMAIIPSGYGSAVQWGTPSLASSITVAQGIGIEAVITFFLAFSVFMTAVNPKSAKIGGLGVGLTLTILVLFAGPFTGAAANPSVALGPAIATGNFTNWYVYWIGPVSGAIIAALICEYILLRKN
ncbi:MAG TPA: aquaporin [Candidatus Acidoferrum sp.]|nr:aquaporin [Candidatus Acidoferrum sp.]